MQGNEFYPQTAELQDVGVQRTENDECYFNQVDSLRFEVKKFLYEIGLNHMFQWLCLLYYASVLILERRLKFLNVFTTKI